MAALVARMARLYRKEGRAGGQGIAQDAIAGVLATFPDGFEYLTVREAFRAPRALKTIFLASLARCRFHRFAACGILLAIH
jgi:hypothetical protein